MRLFLSILFFLQIYSQQTYNFFDNKSYKLGLQENNSGFNLLSADRYLVDGQLIRNAKIQYIYHDSLNMVEIYRTVKNRRVGFPMFMSYDRFISKVSSLLFRDKLHNYISKKQSAQNSTGLSGFSFGTNLKSKALEKLFGSSEVSLHINGSIEVDVSGSAEKRDGILTSQAEENRSSFSPKLDLRQQFTLEGRIGDKLTIQANQNSESQFDLENVLKVKYKGYEDEIIQSIEAGNIDLSLPATQFVSHGEKNKGLFGIKTKLQFGDLSFTGIASVEKGKKNKITINNGKATNNQGAVEEDIKDYDYIKYKFFFVDTLFRSVYEDYPSDNPFPYKDPSDTKNRAGRVSKLDVYVSAPTGDQNAYYATAVRDYREIATHNLSNDSIKGDEQGVYETHKFKKLTQGIDYKFDQDRGFLYLTNDYRNQAIAISYVVGYEKQEFKTHEAAINFWMTDEEMTKKVREDYMNFRGNASTSKKFLKLIKSRYQTETNTSNPIYKDLEKLHMKNVYYMGYDISTVKVKIYTNNDITNDKPSGAEIEFKSIFGFDRLNNNTQGAVLADKGKGDDLFDKHNPMLLVSDENDKANYLMFPVLEPFNPSQKNISHYSVGSYTWDPELNSKGIYSYSTPPNTSKFKINFEGKRVGNLSASNSTSEQNTIDLGFGVLEGSERVIIGGQTMQPGIDYDINYFAGKLTLKSNRAILGKDNMEVEYESKNLFQLDKRTLIGGRFDYRFNKNAFIGLTALYLKKSSLDEKVRIGQEPFENFVWDINGEYKSKSKFLTRLVNQIPGIQTNAESNFSVQAEFAQIYPNPNTKNNDAANDGDGVAYVDDFEAAKRTSGLTLSRQIWKPASIPGLVNGARSLSLEEKDSNRAQISFFNPYNRLQSNIIFNRETNSKDADRDISILNMAIRKEHKYYDLNGNEITVPDTASIKPGKARQNAWAGIMTSNKHNRDLNNVRFLEVWVQWDYPDRTNVKPKLNIDFGLISENFYTGKQVSGGFLASETTSEIKLTSGLTTASSEDVSAGVPDGVLQSNEDVGMDRMSDDEEKRILGLVNPYDNWEGMRSEAFSQFFLSVNDPNGQLAKLVPWRINGTEGNSQESGYSRAPDTEDIDLDNNINLANDEYYHIEIEMSKDRSELRKNPYFSTFGIDTNNYNWVKFKIPIKDLVDDPNAVYPLGAKPNLNAVDFVRIYVDNFDGLNDEDLIFVNFAGIEFVSSDWQTMTVKDYDDYTFTNTDIGIESETMNIRFMDTEENSRISSRGNNYENYYVPPIGVQRNFKDAERTILAKDRVMVLDIKDLETGKKAEIYKSSRFIANNLSFHNYKKLKMFMRTHRLEVNEKGSYKLPKSKPEFLEDGAHRNYFYVKFGSNDKNFYEYRVPVIANALDSAFSGQEPDANNKDHQAHYWASSNIEIDLEKLTRTKRYGRQVANSSSQESFESFENPSLPPEQQELLERYLSVGKPDVTNIQYLIFGVYNADEKVNQNRPLTTQIWLNELRVTDVRKEVGSAMRVNFSSKLADFMNISARFESIEADFHKINETNTNAKGQSDRENQSLSVLMNVDKFFPETWRLKMPMNFSYNRNVSIPKYFPGSDVRTNYQTEGFGDKIKHLFGFGTYNKEITENSSFSNSKRFTIKLSKNPTDKSWYNKYLLDNLSYDGNLHQTDGSDFQNLSNVNEGHKHDLQYRYAFSPTNFISPFEWVGEGWYINWLSKMKLYYSPSNFNMNLSVNYSKTQRIIRNQAPKEPTITNSSRRSFSLSYKLTESMKFDITRNYQSKLDQVFIGDRKMTVYDLLENIFTNPFKKDAFGNDENITNSFNYSYNPSLISGVTNTFSYKSSFSYRENLAKQDANMKQSKTLSYKLGFSPKSLLSSSASSGSGRSGIGRGRRGQRGTSTEDKKDGEEETSGKLKFDFNWINPLYLLDGFVSIWSKSDISFNKTINNGVDLVEQSLPSLKEQLFFSSGLDVKFKNPSERKFGGSEADSWTVKNDLKLGPVSIDLDNKYDFRETKDPNGNNSFSDTYSYYTGSPENTGLFLDFKNATINKSSKPFGIYIPDWTINVREVEKWPLFKLFSKRASLEHRRTGEVKTNYRNDPVNNNPVSGYKFTVKQEYKPFLRLSSQLKWGVDLKFTYNQSTSFNFDNNVTGTLVEDDSYSIDLGYNIKGGFRFPFKFWPFNGSYVQNDIKINLNIFSQDRKTKNYHTVAGEVRQNQGQFSKSFRLEPSITYQFSKTVNGAAYYRYDVQETQLRGTTTKNAFGFKVNLIIRN